MLKKKLKERLAQLEEEKEELRGIGYSDRDLRILESHYRDSYEVACSGSG